MPVSSCDCTSPDACREVTRKARNEHHCYECRECIRRGEEYVYVSGIWDGHPDSYHFHADCMTLRRLFEKHVREGKESERIYNNTMPFVGRRYAYDCLCDCVPFGGLQEALEEFCSEVHGYSP